MKNLKFKAWIIPQKRMIDVYGFNEKFVFAKDYNSPEDGENIFEIDDCILLQFTGLKDINGNDIYDADIVKWGHCKNSKELFERYAVLKLNPDIQFNMVYFKHSKTKVKKEADGYVFHFGSFAYKDTENHVEKIGNIYQNHELLK